MSACSAIAVMMASSEYTFSCLRETALPLNWFSLQLSDCENYQRERKITIKHADILIVQLHLTISFFDFAVTLRCCLIDVTLIDVN